MDYPVPLEKTNKDCQLDEVFTGSWLSISYYLWTSWDLSLLSNE
jgi:hypothetical protein